MKILQAALQNLKTAWVVKLSLCLAFILSFGVGSQNIQAQEATQTAIYEIYAGGVHALQATMEIDLNDKDAYSIDLDAKTRGMLGKLAPWSGTFASNGWAIGNGSYRPQLHKSVGIWRGEKETKEYKYTKDRKFNGLVITEHEKKPQKKDVSDELTHGTSDVLTSALMAFQTVSQKDTCNSTSEVFDGKRRFKMMFNDQGIDILNATKYNVFDGQARKCSVEVSPLKGAWHKKPRGWMSIQEQGRERGTMPTMWIAKLSENAPAVPVKILIKTAYGALFIHLTEYRNGDTVLVSKKRQKQI